MEITKQLKSIGVLAVIGGQALAMDPTSGRANRRLRAPGEQEYYQCSHCERIELATSPTHTRVWRPGEEEQPFTD